MCLEIRPSNSCRNRNSSINIETRNALGGPGLDPRRKQTVSSFRFPFKTALEPSQSSIEWLTVLFSGAKRPVCNIDYTPQLAPRLRMGRAISLYIVCYFMAFYRAVFTFY
jgi:hypothetical protein